MIALTATASSTTPARSRSVVAPCRDRRRELEGERGRADRLAVASVNQDGIDDWQEFEVGWASLHDAGSEGSHHARVARFLREHGVEAVAAHHMGAGMTHMLEKMGLTVRLGETGSAREAAARMRGGERDIERPSTPR